MAGAEGFEPPKAVLETAGLPLAYAPRCFGRLLLSLPNLQSARMKPCAIHPNRMSKQGLRPFPILSRDVPDAYGRKGKTSSSRDDQWLSSCSLSCCNCDSYIRCTATELFPAAYKLCLLDLWKHFTLFDLGNCAGADGAPAFTNRKPQALIHCHRRN